MWDTYSSSNGAVSWNSIPGIASQISMGFDSSFWVVNNETPVPGGYAIFLGTPLPAAHIGNFAIVGSTN